MTETKTGMQVEYLEIVTPEVDATCSRLETQHGVRFSPPDPSLGNARTARLDGGGMIGVRAPVRDDEDPVVRPYLLVSDIAAAVQDAERGGAVVAMPPTEIPGHGTFAIYLSGGIDYGLWHRPGPRTSGDPTEPS